MLHPVAPHTSLQKLVNHKEWVPIANVLCKLMLLQPDAPMKCPENSLKISYLIINLAHLNKKLYLTTHKKH